MSTVTSKKIPGKLRAGMCDQPERSRENGISGPQSKARSILRLSTVSGDLSRGLAHSLLHQVRWILQFGEHGRLLAPDWLVKDVRETIERIMEDCLQFSSRSASLFFASGRQDDRVIPHNSGIDESCVRLRLTMSDELDDHRLESLLPT
jgi:hypothetical protein